MSRDLVKPIRTELILRRLGLGLTQQAVAERIGISQNAIAQLEGGAGEHSKVSTLTRWAAGLDTRLELSLSPLPAEERAGRRVRLAVLGSVARDWSEITPDDREYWVRVARAARDA